jgi:hypothetical protein
MGEEPMTKLIRLGCIVMLGITGCATSPPLDNPLPVRRAADQFENPALVSPGSPTPSSYQEVFEKAVDILDDYFELQLIDAYDGRIVTKPRIAPGYEQIWRGGNPDARDRLLATFQSIRQIATVTITTGERGGYLVTVIVEKELEDVPRPSRATIGNAVFQEAPTVERRLDVVGPAVTPGGGWFNIGRDHACEQLILRRIQECR